MIKVAPDKENKRLISEIDELAKGLSGPFLEKAMRAGALPVVRRMKELTPEWTGLTEKTTVRTKLQRKDFARFGMRGVEFGLNRRALLIGPNKRHRGFSRSVVASWVDAGTKPHKITSQFGKVMRFKYRGRTVRKQVIEHPGIQARNYFKKTIDSSKAEYLERFNKNLARQLKKYGGK